MTFLQVMPRRLSLMQSQVLTQMTLKASRYWRMVQLHLSMVPAPWPVWLLLPPSKAARVTRQSTTLVSSLIAWNQATATTTSATLRSRWVYIAKWRTKAGWSLPRLPTQAQLVCMAACITWWTHTLTASLAWPTHRLPATPTCVRLSLSTLTGLTCCLTTT